MRKAKQSDTSCLASLKHYFGVFHVAGISLKEFWSLQTVLSKSAYHTQVYVPTF